MMTEQQIKVVFHGRLADLLGRSFKIAAPAGCSVAELRDRIATAHPHSEQAIRSDRVRACVGDSLVPESRRLSPEDRVEFLPPVSGG